MEISDLKIILSAAFIFIGSIVFYISSFISGHNIYKDLTPFQSTTLTSMVGFLLFIFSPLSFIILFPTLFNLPDYSQTPIQRDMLLKMHDLLLRHTLLPFLLQAISFGLFFGCLSAIKFRTVFIYWLNKKTGLPVQLQSYEKTWDSIITRIKPKGWIEVKYKDGLLKGRLGAYSLKDEQNQLTLSECTKYGNGEGKAKHGTFFLTESSEIEEIYIPANSFKKHRDFLSHTTLSFYSALIGLALSLLGISLERTSNFLGSFKYFSLEDTYGYMSLCALLAAVGFATTSLFIIKEDYANLRAAAVLCPLNTAVTALTVVCVLLLTPHVLQDIYDYEYNNIFIRHLLIFGTLSAMSFIGYLVIKSKKIYDLFDEIISECQNKDLLKAVLNNLCEAPGFRRDTRQRRRGPRHGYLTELNSGNVEDVEALEGKLSKFFQRPGNSYLYGDEHNVVYRLRWYLSKKTTQRDQSY